MSKYKNSLEEASSISDIDTSNWDAINPNYVARMRLQNQFKTGIDIAKYTASIMRKDMDDYDKDPTAYTQSLGCWHGFIGQQKLISIKKHFGTNNKKYLYLYRKRFTLIKLSWQLLKQLLLIKHTASIVMPNY